MYLEIDSRNKPPFIKKNRESNNERFIVYNYGQKLFGLIID